MSDDYFDWAAARYHDHTKVTRAPANTAATKPPSKPGNSREANGARTSSPGRKLGP